MRFSQAFGSDDLAPAAGRGRAIRPRAEENFEERGPRTLFAAWGMATWTDTRSTFTPCAPVLLCQAHLASHGSAAEDFELSPPGEWEINPTLLHVLASDFEVRITPESLLGLLDPDNDPPDAGLLFDRLVKEGAPIAGGATSARCRRRHHIECSWNRWARPDAPPTVGPRRSSDHRVSRF
jgi:hypothetical protein